MIERVTKFRSKAASVFMGRISSPSRDVSSSQGWWRYPRAVPYPASVGRVPFPLLIHTCLRPVPPGCKPSS